MSKTAEATGYSLSNVRRVVAEKKSREGAAFISPAKRYKQERSRNVVDDFDIEAIQRTVREFYLNKKYPTLDSLLLLKRKVCLMESALLYGNCFVRSVLSIRWSMINVMCMSSHA